MLIERLLRDPGETVVTFKDGTVYRFRPRAEDGAHVAEVANPEHAARMLSIPEGFREVAGAAPAPAAPAALSPAPAPTPQPAPAPQEDAPLAPAPITDGAAAGSDDWKLIGDADLRAMFEREVGRKPSHRAGRDTMIAQIEAARRGE